MKIKALASLVLALAISGLASAGEPAGKLRAARGDSPDFLHDVMPLLSKRGCNAVACHGTQRGKGGFKLSMFGADPAADYEALVKADGGRRVNKVEPLASLFLLKAAGSIPHPPKRKLPAGSVEYNLLAAWVAQGAPLSRENDPALVSLAVSPAERILAKGETCKLTATAIFADGSKKDVTGTSLYSSSDAGVAAVDENGLVKAGGCGQSVIIVSYLRQPATARILVPQPLPMPFPQVAASGKIDELVLSKLKILGIPPSELCLEHEFLRRVYLDVTGTLPTVEQARVYMADQDSQKRGKLIDRLLSSEEFADYWAMKWSDLFRIKSEFPVNLWPNAVQAYHRWVRMSIAGNKPYDQFARELVTATGSNFRDPPANFYRGFLKKDPQNLAEVTALTFMGARIGCARCHGHPTENWTRNDNLGLAAFFSQLKYKTTMEWKEEIVFVDPSQTLHDPRTGELIPPKFLGGATPELGKEQDARAKFAEWLTSPENPWFARNIVNRTWFWLLGRGIVHEVDDLRPTNPPENPLLLDYLAKELVDHKFDLKHVYRLILNSRTYQLSARTNQWNRADVAHFSHYYVKRLGAETLLDAIGQVTGTWDTYRSIIPEPFVVMPAGFRATHLADGSISLPFLELFGRPPRDTAYESDRDLELYLRQTLHLLNSSDVQNKINASPRLAGLLKDAPEDSKIVEALYWATVARPPTGEEMGKILAYFAEADKIVPESVATDQAVAAEALAKIRSELPKANAEFEAATREAKKAAAAVGKAKTPEDKTAAGKAAAEKRKLAASAKAHRDKCAAGEKPAVARLAEANKSLDAAKTAARQRRVQAIQDTLWALLNTKEFVFNH